MFADSSRRALALGVLAFLVGSYQVPLKPVTLAVDSIPGDIGDNRFNNVMLEHGYRWMTGEAASFWHPPFMYPTRWVMGFSDTHLGTLPIYAAFRTIGVGPERAFQLWFLLLGSLNFWSAWWAARKLGLGPAGAAVAAYLFAFGIPVVGFMNHAQLTPRMFVPPAIVWWWSFLTRLGWRNLALTAAAVACQLYCTVYIGFFAVMLIVAMLLAAPLVLGRSLPWKELCRRDAIGWLAVVVAAAVVVLPLVVPHMKASQRFYMEEFQLRMAMVPAYESWLRPTPFALCWTPLWDALDTKDSLLPEQSMFAGLAGLIGLGFGLGVAWTARRSSDEAIRFAAVGAVATLLIAVFTTKFADETLYRFTFDLPGIGGIRAIGRVILVLLFPLGIALGVAVDRVIVATSPKWKGAVTTVLLLGIAVDQSTLPISDELWNGMHFTITEARTRREAATAQVRAHPEASAFYIYVNAADSVHPMEYVSVSIDAMWAATETGVPTVNGYGYPPPGWMRFKTWAQLVEWLEKNGANTEFLSRFIVLGMPTQSP